MHSLGLACLGQLTKISLDLETTVMSYTRVLKPELIEKAKKAVRMHSLGTQVALAIRLELSRSTVSAFFNGKPVLYDNAEQICGVLGWDLMGVTDAGSLPSIEKPIYDWGRAPDLSNFSAREQELLVLEEKIIENQCRLILIGGMEGMGKTNLSYHLGKRVQGNFNVVIWRSIDRFSSLDELLIDLLRAFTRPNDLDIPKTIKKRLNRLKTYLENRRCLLILANVDSFLHDYSFTANCPDCGNLLKWMVEKQENSCLVMTSDVEPKEIDLLSRHGDQRFHRLNIEPLDAHAIRNIFSEIGAFIATDDDWQVLQKTYSGNPFVLKNIAINIAKAFGGDITRFISYGSVVFNGVEKFLDELFEDLPEVEKNVMYWLAIYQYPINIFELKEIINGLLGEQLVVILKHLRLRFLVEGEGSISLPPMIQDYLVNRLIKEACQEITTGRLSLLSRFPLLITTAKWHVRRDQENIIQKKIIECLKNELGTERYVENRFVEILTIQGELDTACGYECGNIVNLMSKLKFDFRHKDFSGLVLKNVNFRDIDLHGTNLSGSDLSNSIFLNAFSNVLSVAFSPDGKTFAIGDTNSQIYVWKMTENRPILRKILASHSHWTRAIAFSPDSKVIAYGGEDGNIYLRGVKTGADIARFEGHIDRVRSISFSPDAKLLASGSDDGTIRIWDVVRNEFITALIRHKDKVRVVIFHPRRSALVSASQDNQICIWKVVSPSNKLEKNLILENCFHLEENESHLLRAIALSPDGEVLASGSDDGVIRLWNSSTGSFIQSFGKFHANWIRSLSFSPCGDMIASASEDKTVRIWDVKTGRCLHTLRDHTGRVWSIAFHPYNSWLASGDDGLKVKLWHTNTGECLYSFKGYSHETRPVVFNPDGKTLATGNNQAAVYIKDELTGKNTSTLKTDYGNIWALAYSPDGSRLIGGNEDTTIKVWNSLLADSPPRSLKGHSNWVRTVDYSCDGTLIASGSDDKTVRLWDAHSLECLCVLDDHSDWVRSVCFHPTKSILATGSDDGTINLWDTKSFNLLQSLPSTQRQIWTVAIHPEGRLLASGSNDNTIAIWDLETCQRLTTLKEHLNWISSVSFSPDGKWLSSASYDTTIRLWDLSSEQYKCSSVLQGHGKAAISVAFHPQKPILASSSKDGSIKQWNILTGKEVESWQSPKPYQNVNLISTTGLTAAERMSSSSLGAVTNR